MAEGTTHKTIEAVWRIESARLIFDRVRQVEVHLLGLAGRDERRACDEAAIALRELRALPDVAEEDVVGQIDQLRREITERLTTAKDLRQAVFTSPRRRGCVLRVG